MTNDASNPSECEQWYDTEIAPALMAIARKCEAAGVAMVATVEYGPGHRSSTFVTPPSAGLAMHMLRICASSGNNVDSYIITLLRYLREKGINTDESMVLSRFTGHLR